MRRFVQMIMLVFGGVWGGVVAYRMSTEAITVLATGLVVVLTAVVVGGLLVISGRRTERREQMRREQTNRWTTAAPPVVVINPGIPKGAEFPGWRPGTTGSAYLPPPGSPEGQATARQFTVIGEE
jgi:hypothetical protein